MRLSLPRGLFWFGVLWFALGLFISFIPGAEMDWFATAGILIAFGLFVPLWLYRIAALSLVVICTDMSLDGYRRGIKYRQFMEERHTATPILQQKP